MDSNLEDIGKRIKMARGKMSRREFADLFSTSVSSIGRYEAGNDSPPLKIIRIIHLKFNISLEWLLFGVEPMHCKGALSVSPVVNKIEKDLEKTSLSTENRFLTIENHLLRLESRLLRLESRLNSLK